MNKKAKYFIRTAVSGFLAATTFLAAGCGQTGGGDPTGDNNPLTPGTARYKEALILSTDVPDGVFNPFFSTALADTNILSNTQLSMLSTDKNGKIVCGDNEPCVVKDYSVRTVSENGKNYTYYQFVIKNGIKFSDGESLTIDDVLFNLYVYLDPAYTGSATIYSTDIVGLLNYRTQSDNASTTTSAEFDQLMQSHAQERIDRLVNYVYFVSDYTFDGDKVQYDDGLTATQIEAVKEDYKAVRVQYRKELESDWATTVSSMQTYMDDNGFTAAWQVFLMNDGYIDFYEKTPTGAHVKDENGKLKFDPNDPNTIASQNDLNEYLQEKNVTGKPGDTAYDEAVKTWAIDSVFGSKFGATMETTDGAYVEEVLTYWNTANVILTEWTADAITDYFASSGGRIKTITGIQAKTGTAFVADKENSSSATATYSKDYDMLEIKINGVDPKAIYNFAYVVAPMHYYSTHDYKGVDYIKAANRKDNFGFPMGDSDFFRDVINAPSKNGVPVGAGVYKATNSSESDKPDATGNNGFLSNNWVYFKRNEYFYTVGSGLSNANIRLLRYKVTTSDQIINSLIKKEIHFGEPSATTDSIDQLDGANIRHIEVDTNGYGYVGINARFVPNITVRRAIMKAMNRKTITDNYYKDGLATIIERSMSTTSWAYPDGAQVYTAKDGTSYQYDSTKNEITQMLKSLEKEGYRLNADGVYTNGSDTLDYTFTIAGQSNDHPAFKMFNDAKDLLNSIPGIHVKVETNPQALQQLAAGGLQVWAAAWTSTIDPDLYQVYHKDSKASSILNWGYDYIKKDQTTYSYEYSIVTELSTIIDQARKITNQSERTGLYSRALDMVMELAVELPTYQRKDMFAFCDDILDESTMQHDDENVKQLSPYNGPLSRIWEVDYTEAFKASHGG